MNKYFKLNAEIFFFTAFILSFPIYFFSSGSLQLSHVFMCGFLLSSIRIDGLRYALDFSFLKALFIFVVYSFIINAYYAISYEDLSPLKYSINYIINFLFCVGCFSLSRSFFLPRFFLLSIFMSIISQVVLSFVFLPQTPSGRFTILFNNPNQLAYFSLLSLLIFSYMSVGIIRNQKVMFMLFFCAGYLIFLTTSKAAMVGYILFIILWSAFSVRVNKVKNWVASILIVISSGYLANSMVKFSVCKSKGMEIEVCLFSSPDKGNLVIPRLQSIGGDKDDSFQGRGYDRILNEPSYLLLGAGEGLFERFRGGKELHSIPGTLLFSYGVAGLIFLICISVMVLRVGGYNSLLYLAPIVPYVVTHNGFRSPFLWVLVLILVVDMNGKTPSESTHSEA